MKRYGTYETNCVLVGSGCSGIHSLTESRAGCGVAGFSIFKQKTAYEMLRSLVGSEMCIETGISDIASQVGFTGESNFIHQFKSIVGETPAAYRKNNWGF